MSERRLINMDGAKAVKNSGRGMIKGDAKLPPFLLDYKEYEKSISISSKMWEKHATDAWEQSHQEPCLALVFGDKTRLAVIDWHMFRYMRECMLYVQEHDITLPE